MILKARRALSVALFIIQSAACIAVLAAPQKSNDKPQAQDKPLRLRTDEVIVDAVVLDKRSHTISDLTADDFELFEDGVKQKINSFRFESNRASSDTLSEGAKAASATSRTINLITLVFDAQTDRDGALRARKAALDYIANGIGPNDYVAVFGIDAGLLLLEPYTNDKVAIRQAVEVFTSRESKKYLAAAGEARRALEGLVEPLSDAKKIAMAESLTDFDLEVPVAATEDTRDPNSGIDAGRVMMTELNLSGLKILRVFERYERDYQGHRHVDALLAIINGLKSVRAGRKVMMLFSEGFAVTPAVTEQYKSVISAANTTGVTIYAFDIAGLRIVNPNMDAMLERDVAGVQRMRNTNPELVTGGSSALGKSEEAARLNVLTTLDELSEETGGYTIKNTNDISEGLKRILDEIGNHYVITYQPSNADFNGKFRRISVKLVREGDFKVHARRGYYALRTLDDSPVMAHEVPMLERVNGASFVNDFPINIQAFSFRGTSTAGLVALYAEFPVSALTFGIDDKTKSFSSKYALLVLVKNPANEVVRKLGQEFVLRGPVAQLEDVKKRPQLYNRLALLPPGHYTLEAAARDSSGKTAVARLPFEVTEAREDNLRISSVVLSRGVNPLTEEQKKRNHPLFLEGQAYFVPNLLQTFKKSQDKKLLMHFNVYPAKAGPTNVEVTVTFLSGGKTISEASGALPAPDATGRILYVTSFGTENFSPGEYTVRVLASDGAHRASSSAQFKVDP